MEPEEGGGRQPVGMLQLVRADGEEMGARIDGAEFAVEKGRLRHRGPALADQVPFDGKHPVEEVRAGFARAKRSAAFGAVGQHEPPVVGRSDGVAAVSDPLSSRPCNARGGLFSTQAGKCWSAGECRARVVTIAMDRMSLPAVTVTGAPHFGEMPPLCHNGLAPGSRYRTLSRRGCDSWVGRQCNRGLSVTRKYLLGAAVAALLAGTGAAHAADVVPVVVAVNPTAPAAVVVGPTITADIVSRVYSEWYSEGVFFVGEHTFGEVDVKLASGWGFILFGDADINFIPGYGLNYRYGFEVYRALGNVEVGFIVKPYNFSPLDIELGPTFRYETDTLEIDHETTFGFWPGGRDIDTWTNVTYQANENLEVRGFFDLGYDSGGDLFVGLAAGATLTRGRYEIDGYADFAYYNFTDPDLDIGALLTITMSDRLDLYAYADAELLNGVYLEVGGGAELDFGAITVWAEAGWNGVVWGEVGVDVKKPVGTGGLQLIGGAEVGADLDGYVRLNAFAGLRYVLGEDDDEY